MNEETQRLFFALWPEADIRDRLRRLMDGAIPARGRKMAPGNLHVTLRFLGNVNAGIRERMEGFASGLRVEPFTLVLDRLGYWVRPRIVWVGATRVPAPLASLAAELNRGAAECGLELDRRPYVPHVTLMRKAFHRPRFVPVEPIVWPARSFVLVISENGDDGVAYRVVRTWPLQGGVS